VGGDNSGSGGTGGSRVRIGRSAFERLVPPVQMQQQLLRLVLRLALLQLVDAQDAAHSGANAVGHSGAGGGVQCPVTELDAFLHIAQLCVTFAPALTARALPACLRLAVRLAARTWPSASCPACLRTASPSSQALAANREPSSFARALNHQRDRCCDQEGQEDACNRGFPTVCTRECAALIVPFLERCHKVMDILGPDAFPEINFGDLGRFVAGPCHSMMLLTASVDGETCAEDDLVYDTMAADIHQSCCMQEDECVVQSTTEACAQGLVLLSGASQSASRSGQLDTERYCLPGTGAQTPSRPRSATALVLWRSSHS
jgi:hypothetical protein